MNYVIGFVAAGVAILFFGSNFLPVKKFKTGDGMFFQWVMCVGIWLVGLAVQLIRGSPKFQPFAMLGGALWATGNAMVVPIIKTIGLGLGLMLWGMFNLLMGWCSGTFGLFGLQKEQDLSNPVLNYVGAAVALASVAVFAFIKPELTDQRLELAESDKSVNPVLHEQTSLIDGESKQIADTVDDGEESSWVDYLSTGQKRVVGISLSVLSGACYGVNFDPPQYLVDHGKGSDNLLDYVFSHFTGILLTSTAYFMLYAAFMKNKPQVHAEIILPAIISGIMWAIADTAWFVANDSLSLVVAFPIITTGPGVIGTLWGILLYGEIRGKKNFILFAIGFAITLVASILIALSKL